MGHINRHLSSVVLDCLRLSIVRIHVLELADEKLLVLINKLLNKYFTNPLNFKIMEEIT